jgi:transposase
VVERGYGGQLLVEKELGWDRGTIRKGIKELESGITCIDNYRARGRKKAEEHLPSLLSDIKSIVDSQSQTDPSFKSEQLYTRLTTAEVRKQLMKQFGYSDKELPNNETIRIKLNELKYSLKRVAKVKREKKSLAQKHQLNIRLAYYPPYHSKYNQIERTWAALEKHSLRQYIKRNRDRNKIC